MVTRQEVVDKAREFKGVRWQHQGRTPKALDCAGLVVIVANQLELSAYNFTNYHRRPDGSFLSRFEEGGCVRKKITEARLGDILIFSESGHACHSGIMSEKFNKPAVIHAHAMRGKVIEETLEAAVSMIRRPTHCYTYPNLED